MKKKIFGYEYDKKYDYENGFYLTSSISRTAKLITHWELYKKIIKIPGEVLELGIYKGASFIRFLTFREMLESQYSRKVIGFDSFGEFPLTESHEDNKFIKKFIDAGGNGISKKELEEVLPLFGRYKNLHIKGLMTIAPNVDDAEDNRKIFKKLKKLSVDISEKNYDNIEVKFLSMGMTGDYMVALEEGANFVRVGTGIFGKR